MSREELFTNGYFIQDKFESVSRNIGRLHKRIDNLDGHIDQRMDRIEQLVQQPKTASWAARGGIGTAIVAGLFSLYGTFITARPTTNQDHVDAMVHQALREYNKPAYRMDVGSKNRDG